MKNILLSPDYLLVLKSEVDNYKDYIIYFNNQEIGVFQIVEKDKIFIRNIRIDEDFQRQGHATEVMDYFLLCCQEPIQLCITTVSEKAIYFWNKYLATKNATHIRGHIYEIN